MNGRNVGLCLSQRAPSRWLVVIPITLTLYGCASWTRGTNAQQSSGEEKVERSTLRLAKTPEHAAACIVENARATGNAAELVPLYGMQSVGVTVKTSATGDVIAVFSLTQSDAGAVANTTMWRDVSGGGSLVQAFVKGC